MNIISVDQKLIRPIKFQLIFVFLMAYYKEWLKENVIKQFLVSVHFEQEMRQTNFYLFEL
jgi:hypothetical protein